MVPLTTHTTSCPSVQSGTTARDGMRLCGAEKLVGERCSRLP